jgi:hypothetical protein
MSYFLNGSIILTNIRHAMLALDYNVSYMWMNQTILYGPYFLLFVNIFFARLIYKGHDDDDEDEGCCHKITRGFCKFWSFLGFMSIIWTLQWLALMLLI